MARDVSEREFVNYAKGLGNYCTYGETRGVLVGLLRAFAIAYPSFIADMAVLLPRGVQGLLSEALRSDEPMVHRGDSTARESFLETMRLTAQLCETDRPGHTVRVFFGTVKEKSQELRPLWAEVIPLPLREDWDRSITIDQVQDPGQCL